MSINMTYNYKMTEFLSQELHDPNKFYDIHLCVYQVNTQGKLPFLSYLLTNEGFGAGFGLGFVLITAFLKLKLSLSFLLFTEFCCKLLSELGPELGPELRGGHVWGGV